MILGCPLSFSRQISHGVNVLHHGLTVKDLVNLRIVVYSVRLRFLSYHHHHHRYPMDRDLEISMPDRKVSALGMRRIINHHVEVSMVENRWLSILNPVSVKVYRSSPFLSLSVTTDLLQVLPNRIHDLFLNHGHHHSVIHRIVCWPNGHRKIIKIHRSNNNSSNTMVRQIDILLHNHNNIILPISNSLFLHEHTHNKLGEINHLFIRSRH